MDETATGTAFEVATTALIAYERARIEWEDNPTDESLAVMAAAWRAFNDAEQARYTV